MCAKEDRAVVSWLTTKVKRGLGVQKWEWYIEDPRKERGTPKDGFQFLARKNQERILTPCHANMLKLVNQRLPRGHLQAYSALPQADLAI